MSHWVKAPKTSMAEPEPAWWNRKWQWQNWNGHGGTETGMAEPELAWWEQKIDSCQLFSDPHTRAISCSCDYTCMHHACTHACTLTKSIK